MLCCKEHLLGVRKEHRLSLRKTHLRGARKQSSGWCSQRRSARAAAAPVALCHYHSLRTPGRCSSVRATRRCLRSTGRCMRRRGIQAPRAAHSAHRRCLRTRIGITWIYISFFCIYMFMYRYVYIYIYIEPGN